MAPPMPAADRRLLGERVRKAIADLVRVRSGRIPGTQLLDLASEGGYLADRIARRADDWIVHAATLPAEPPGNVEEADVDLDGADLALEGAQLATVMASAVDEPLELTRDLVEEVHRVLGDDGRVLIAYRAPGPRAPNARRGLPAGAADLLRDVGFDDVTDTKEKPFRDGSELWLLRGVKA